MRRTFDQSVKAFINGAVEVAKKDGYILYSIPRK
jgi:hypothetical protein